MFDKSKIVTCMNKKGWTKYRLAKEAGIGQSTLSEILSNKKKNPSIDTLKKIADALGVPVDYLLRKSPTAIIEDKLKELNMTFDELLDKTKIPITFFDNLDNIIPDEGDYKRLRLIATTLNMDPKILFNALSRQEPPMYDGPSTSPEEDFEPVLKKSSNQITDVKEAMDLILSQPGLMLNGEILSDESKIALANAIQMGMAYAEQMQKKDKDK